MKNKGRMREQTMTEIWAEVDEAKTGKDAFTVLMDRFTTQQEAAKYLGVAKSRISEMKKETGPVTEKRKIWIFGGLMRKRSEEIWGIAGNTGHHTAHNG